MKFKQLGWVLAAAIGAVLMASGFQGVTEKTGVVNLQKLVTTSSFGKTSQASIDAMSTVRKDLLTFANENSVMTVEQAQALRDLSLKSKRTSEEDLKLAQTRADLTSNTKKLQDLAKKPSPTQQEKDLINDFGARLQNAQQMLQGWGQEFQNEIQAYGESQYALTSERANAALQEVAKAQSFTTIFDSRYAIYGASDVTDAALAAMNAKP